MLFKYSIRRLVLNQLSSPSCYHLFQEFHEVWSYLTSHIAFWYALKWEKAPNQTWFLRHIPCRPCCLVAVPLRPTSQSMLMGDGIVLIMMDSPALMQLIKPPSLDWIYIKASGRTWSARSLKLITCFTGHFMKNYESDTADQLAGKS